jgi:hypothetical protein
MIATHHPSERETQGAIDFDAALEGYASGYDDPEVLLRAAKAEAGVTTSGPARAIARREDRHRARPR